MSDSSSPSPGNFTTRGSSPSQPPNSQQSSPIPNGISPSTHQQQPPPTTSPSSPSPPSPPSSSSSPPPSPPPSPPQTSTSTSQPPPPPTTSSSSAPPPPPSSTSHSSAASPPTTFVSSIASPSSPATSAPVQPTPSTPIVTVTHGNSVTSIEVVTSLRTSDAAAAPTTSAKTSSSGIPAPINPGDDGNGSGPSQPAKVAIGVVVPIAAIALLALLGLWWWRKRKARQESEEERRKEVEDYAYNPNADPTAPAVRLGPDSYEMRDGELGYRGWGSTTVGGSMGRKTSTTMSGGKTAAAFSDGGGHTRGNLSDSKTDSNMDSSSSPDGSGEILGAMGPSAANNRNGDVHRGPSNASSSYSATGRSEGSDGGMYPTGGAYYEQYGQTPYGGDQRAQDLGGQAVIRDNPARRNTRIENPSHYPQQSAGIAQNF